MTARRAGYSRTGAWTGQTVTIGTNVQAYNADLAALAALDTTAGLMAKTGAAGYSRRTLTGTASRVTVTNGTGASADPTVDIDTAYVGQATITTLGTVTTGTWNATAPVGSATASAASFSPDGSASGNTVCAFFYTVTGAATVNAPVNLVVGRVYTFVFIQSGAGAFAVTFNAAYKAGTATATLSATGNATGKKSTILFVADTTTSMIQVAAQVAYA